MNIEELFSPDKIYITTAALATIALFFVSVLIGVTIRRRQRQIMEHCRYRPRKRLMEGNEKRCFQLLVELFGHRFYIIPQVELSALLNHKVGTQDRQTALRFIEDKSVDFVLCNKRSLRPICAVKLDDGGYASQPLSKRERRRLERTPGYTPSDMSAFFKSAHIPFVYLPKTEPITTETLIDNFSKTIYETSLPAKKKAA